MDREALPRGIPRKRDRHLQTFHKPPHVLSVKEPPLIVPPHQFNPLKPKHVSPVHQHTQGKIRHTPHKKHLGLITQEFAKLSESVAETDSPQD